MSCVSTVLAFAWLYLLQSAALHLFGRSECHIMCPIKSRCNANLTALPLLDFPSSWGKILTKGCKSDGRHLHRLDRPDAADIPDASCLRDAADTV